MNGPVPKPWVDLRHVTVRYDRVQALDQVTLRIAPGERVALVGANGSGKSTLLRVLHGLADTHGGGLQCDASLRQAMLFQRPHMLRTSAQNNVALALWLRGTRWRDARPLALTALQRVGLQGIAAQNARTLSGGQQQRVALARAWALRPDVLLLDEPTASLDPGAVEAIERIVREIRTDGTRILMTTHNLGQATRLADDVVFMDAGRVCEHAPVQRFFARPASQAARLYIQGELPWRMAF